MSKNLATRLHQLLSLLVILSLLIPAGLASAQEGGTETPAPTDTPAPAETATPEATVTETPTETPTEIPTEAAAPAPAATSSRGGGDPRLSSVLNDLAEAYASGGPTAAMSVAEAQGLSLQAAGENVQVVAMLAPGKSSNEARDLVASLGGLVEVDIDALVQISLPIGGLQALATSDLFLGVRLPAYAEEVAVTSEGKTTSNASAWQAVGLTGKGVKVAILDTGFTGYTTLYGTELPPVTRIHTRSFRADLNLQTSSHGREVAEIVYDMAPDAELWLVSISTDLEFSEAMDWLITQNVDIINASIGWTNYDDGDGDSSTGVNNALVDSVNRVNTAGILYVAAAGNSAVGHAAVTYVNSGGFHLWDADIYNEINNWTDCPPGFSCYVEANLAWNDWGDAIPGKDYDLFIMQNTGAGWVTVASSFNDQLAGYPWPTERVGAFVPSGGQVAIVVQRFNSSTSEYLEMFVNGWDLQVDSNTSTILSPADAANAFTVGAYNHLSGSHETYSSRGPVNEAGGAAPSGDEAVKPDITGPDCTTTSLSDGSTGEGFCGTSGAAPHVAGAAALVLQADPTRTNAQLRSFLETAAEADAGDPTAGKDNQWGWGKLILGAAPAGPAACPTCINSAGWPLFQNGVTRAGAGTSAISTTASLLWTSPLLTADVRSVVVGSGALAYVKAGRYVYALNKQFGTIAWTFDLGAAGVAKGPGAPALTDGGSPAVFVGSGDGYVYKIEATSATPNGVQVCKSAKLGTDLSKASPLIGADGTVYFVDDTLTIDRLIAVNPADCSQRWAVNLGTGATGAGTSSPAYWANPADPNTTDDLIFVGADKLYAFTIWGGPKWSAPIKTGVEVATVPTTPTVIDPGGAWKVYVVNSLGDLYSANAIDGTSLVRAHDAPAGAHASGSIAAFDNGAHFFLYWGHLAVLYKHDTFTSTTTPTPPLTIGGSLTDASPVVDSANNVFIGSTDGKVYGINGGTMADLDGPGTVWPKIAAISTAGGLAILNTDLYVPSTDDRVRVYGTLPGTCATCNTEVSDWPTFQRGVNRNGDGIYTVGTSPLQLWNRAPGGDVFPPIVGPTSGAHPRGIAYFVTGRYLRAFDIDTRNVIWSYDLGLTGTATGFAAPALANQTGAATGFADGIVYVGGKDGFLHAVYADGPNAGQRLWATDVGLDISKASPLIDNNGVVYVVEDGAVDRLIAVTHEGAVKWAASIGAALGTSSPAYDGTCVYVGGKNLYGFNATDGTTCTGWPAGGYQLGVVTTTVPSAPIIVGTDDLYALNNLGDLYHINLASLPVPPLVVEYDTPAGVGSGSLAYDTTNALVYWTLGGKLYKWDGATPGAITLSGATTNSTPVIDSAGNVFVGTSDNKLWKVPSGGSTATVMFTALGSMASAGAITVDPNTNGVLLWPSLDDKLYAFGTPEGTSTCPGCALASVEWPAFQSNAAHAPVEQGGGGATIRKTRQFTAVGATRPAVADASNIYFVAGQYLYARNKNTDAFAWGTVGGVEKKYNLGLAVTAGFYAMPALATDGANTIIYVGGSDGNLHAVNAATGDLIWKTDVGNNISKASPIVSDLGLIFVVEDNATPDRLIALDSTGTIIWSQLIGLSNGTSSPAIDAKSAGITDDVVLVGGGGGLYAFDVEDGAPVFTSNYGVIAPASPLTNGSPVVFNAVDPDLDGYYVVSGDGVLWRVSFNGLTVTNLGDADGALLKGGKSAAPLILESAGSANIFFGLGNKLYKVTYDGVSAPAAPTATTLGGVLGDSTPLAGDGHVYIGSTDLKFYSIQQAAPPLTATAVYTHTASLAGSGAFMDADHVVWPAQDGKQLVFTNGVGDPGSLNTANGQWPLFQRNDAHTGTAASALSSSAIEQWAVLTAGDVRGVVIGNATLQPVAYPQGLAYFVAGTKLYALDVATHLIAKQWDLGATSGVSGYSSPAVITVDNGANDEEWVFVADKLGVVRAYGFRWNGAAYEWVTNPSWSVDVGLDASKASVLAGHNDLVYVVEDTLGVDRLHAINRVNGSLLWSANLGAGAGSSSPAFYDDGGNGVVYVGSDKLYAIDAMTGVPETGSPITLATPAPGMINSAPLIIGTDVYVLTATARLFRVATAGNVVTPDLIGDPAILTTIGASSMARFDAAGADDYLFIATANKLYRYNFNGPALSAPLTLGALATNFTNSTPLVDSAGNVFIGGADGFLYGVDGNTMTAFAGPYNPVDGSGWPKKIGVGTAASSAAGSLALVNSQLYVPSLDDNLRRFGPAPAACVDCDLYTAAQWPMFQHDVAHTGRNGNGAGHRAPIAFWSKSTTTTSAPPRTPVLGPVKAGFANGVLYFTSGQFVLARDAANGNELWRFDLGLLGNPSGGASPALLLVAANAGGVDDDVVNVIVGAKDGFLYALNANTGVMAWRIDLGLDISKASPVIDGDGTIYVVEDTAALDRLHAVYFNGTRKWTRDLAAGTGASSPVLDVANTNVIVGSANKLFAFDTITNALAWATPTTMPAGLFNTSLVVNGDDLWALNNVAGLYRVNPATGSVYDGGAALGIQPMVAGVGLVGDSVAPAIQSDPYTAGYDIIAFTAGTRLYRVIWNNTGNAVVTAGYLSFAGTVGNASPVIDANGWTYTLDSLGYLRAFYRYAFYTVFAKKVATQGTLAGGPIIGNGTNGTAAVYLPSRNNTFYKVGKP
ncbi:MAG: PQQ-binding-like beta-propeller repeat protein [Chloroflexi bacterium]|nr:PQQ-binding-like beta-propeller repeat protein [Chloroflexota bacterium]